jgi:hypothetical protein
MESWTYITHCPTPLNIFSSPATFADYPLPVNINMEEIESVKIIVE